MSERHPSGRRFVSLRIAGLVGQMGERFPWLARFLARSSLLHPALPVLRRILYILMAFACIVYLLAAAVLIGLRYFVLPQINEYRPRIEALASRQLHVPLHIGRLAPRWNGLQPGVDITGLTIRDRNGEIALNVPHASASLSWHSLFAFEPVFSSIVIERANLLIERDANGALFVAGIPVPARKTDNAASATWLMHQQALVLHGGTLRWRDAMSHAPDLEWHDLRVALLNSGHEHRFGLQASAQGTVLHGPLDVRARFRSDLFSAAGKPQNWHGDVYLATGPVDLPTLGRYVKLPVEVYAGRIDNVAWAHFSHGRITSGHGVLEGLDLALHAKENQPPLNMPFMHFTWQAGITSHNYRLRLTDFHAELGQLPLAGDMPFFRELEFHTFEGRFREASAYRGQLISARGDRTDLSIIAALMRRLPLPAPLLDALVRFDPHGVMENYDITLERAAPGSGRMAMANTEPVVHYHLNGDLQGIGFAAQPAPAPVPMPAPVLASASSPLQKNHLRVGLPGVENLWGRIDTDEKHGTLTLDTANTSITIPGLFDEPQLAFSQLSGAASWTVAPQRAAGEMHKAFRITVQRLAFTTATASATFTATYTNPGHGPGTLDLQSRLARLDLNHLARYLPASMTVGLRHYLGHSLVAGTVKNAAISVHGNLADFPYARHPQAGQFHIVAPFSGGRFDPSPVAVDTRRPDAAKTWPMLDGIDGKFTLDNNKLNLGIAHAHYQGFTLAGVTGHINDLGNLNNSFIVTGTGNGPLATLLDYVNHSPLASVVNHSGEKIHAQGAAKLTLTLTVPRTPKPVIGVTGTLGFIGNQLAMDGVPPLSNLMGNANFTNHSAQFTHLTGHLLGGDVSASGGLRTDGHYAIDMTGQLDANANEVRGMAPSKESAMAALLAGVHGATQYTANVQGMLHGGMPNVDVHASLTGLTLDFPAPLNKAASAAMPLHFTFAPQTAADVHGAALSRASLTLGPLNAVYELRSTAGKAMQVVRGALGVNRPAELPGQGVTATADLPSFDADAWRDVLAQHAAQPDETNSAAPHPHQPPPASSSSLSSASGGAFAQYLPSRFALHIGTLTLWNRRWANLVVNIMRSSEQWQASVASNQIAGHLSWQPGDAAKATDAAGTLSAHLTRLIVPTAASNDVHGRAAFAPVSAAASHMPAIHLSIDQLVVLNHDLGQLQVHAHNAIDGNGEPIWQLDTLDLKNPAAHLAATANWSMRPFALNRRALNADNPVRHTQLDFHLDISDAGALLDRVGLPHVVRAGAGTLSGNVTWQGGPTAINYPTLHGTVALDLHHGQILKVDPGAAKLLGVLSLQSLARFVTLNFRDVVGKGLPFSDISGSSRIHHGIAHIDRFSMNTSPAKVNIQGTVDLAQETQTLRVHVTPELHAGVGVVALTAINPLLGLGAFAADMALSHSISSVFASDYTITGPWANPHIKQLRNNAGTPDNHSPAFMTSRGLP